MKGGYGGSSYSFATKRRWKGLVMAVLGLVFLSMLVSLVFLLGLHNGFLSSAGYATVQSNSATKHLRVYDQHRSADTRNQSKRHQSAHVDDLIRRLVPTPTKSEDQEGYRNSMQAGKIREVIHKFSRKYQDNSKVRRKRFKKNVGEIPFREAENETDGIPIPADLPKPGQKRNNTGLAVTDDAGKNFRGADESEKLCELKYGSYCLWRREHREKMKDAVVKKMKDLLYVARAYYPSIAKLPAFGKLSQELKQNIQDFERVFSEATTDKDLPLQIEKKLTKMEAAIARAKSCPVDCNNVDKKLRQLVDLTEDEANFHRKQSAFLYQLAVQTMPKSLHCLSLRLTVEYFRSSLDLKQSLSEKVSNPDLHHYVIFSRNLLASSVAINSTVQNTEESEKQVFHVLTDKENYFAMKLWFFINKYREATVQVLNIEDLKLNNHYKLAPLHLSLPEEFRVSFLRVDKLSSYQIRTEYLSIFSHSHYLLPKIFPTLKKVVVLDDDILTQRDLSELWTLDMGGKVNGVVQFCAVKLGQLKNYLPRNSFSENSCAWMSGVNIIDLSRWREHNVTERFQMLVQEMSSEEGLSETATLSASMLTFEGLVYALDESWMLSGLGLNYGHDEDALRRAAVLHFNGNMKPWLELGIPKYKSSWRKFLNLQNQFLSDCNVNP